jgi:hypothetical protein
VGAGGRRGRGKSRRKRIGRGRGGWRSRREVLM